MGGLLIAAFGEASPFFVNAASYTAMASAVRCLLPTPASVMAAARSFRNEILEESKEAYALL